MFLNLLHEFLLNSAREYPDKTALVCGSKEFTYRKLLVQTSTLAAWLSDNGLQRGDRVIVYLDNSAEAVISIFGTLLAGGAFSVVNPSVKLNKFMYIVGDSEPRFIITSAHRAASLLESEKAALLPKIIGVDGKGDGLVSFTDIVANERPAPPVGSVDLDLAAIIYTSGSTGDPKGVALTHRNMVTAAKSITTYLENVADDIVLSVLPLSFDYGLYQVLMTLLFSGTLILEKKFGYPFQLLQLIDRYGVTGLPCVPTMMAILLQLEKTDRVNLTSVRYISNTGAALPPAFVPRLKKLFPKVRIYSMYGLTECKRVSYLPPDLIDEKPDSVGIPMPNTEVFVDTGGNLTERDAEGELVVRGSNVMQGYWRDNAATGRVLKPGRFPWEKVLFTGDLFRIDEDGFLYFRGRMDDIIKSRGERISPKEIENVLYELQDIVEVRVIPVPDAILGNAIKVEIVKKPDSGITEKEVMQHCRDNLEELMLPKYIEFVDHLAKSDAGKILKRKKK